MKLKSPPNKSDINKAVVRRNSQKHGIAFFGSRASDSFEPSHQHRLVSPESQPFDKTIRCRFRRVGWNIHFKAARFRDFGFIASFAPNSPNARYCKRSSLQQHCYSSTSSKRAWHAVSYATRIRRDLGKNCKQAVVNQYEPCMQSVSSPGVPSEP